MDIQISDEEGYIALRGVVSNPFNDQLVNYRNVFTGERVECKIAAGIEHSLLSADHGCRLSHNTAFQHPCTSELFTKYLSKKWPRSSRVLLNIDSGSQRLVSIDGQKNTKTHMLEVYCM